MKGSPSYYATYCSPVLITPALAKDLSIPKALILKQLQYWLYKPKNNYSKVISVCRDINGNTIKNHRWIKDSYSTFSRQLGCLTSRAVKRNLKWLRENAYVFVFNQKSSQKTYGINWYTINYDKLNKLFLNSKYTPNISLHDDWNNLKQGSSSVQNAFRDMKNKYQKVLTALKKSQDNEKNLRKSLSGRVYPKGSERRSLGGEYGSQGVVNERHKGSERASHLRGERRSYPTNENENHYESLHETVEERPDQQIKDKMPSNQVPLDPSYLKVERAYTDTFGQALTINGSNQVYKLVKRWNADLVIIAIHVTASNLTVTEDYRILGYARKVLEDYTRKGITTAKQWHDAHQRRDNHDDAKAGGTPSDMRNLSFYEQMCKICARVRTGKILFPPVNDSDKRNGHFVVKACDVLAKRKHRDRHSFDFGKLAKSDGKLAKSIVESENKENV